MYVCRGHSEQLPVLLLACATQRVLWGFVQLPDLKMFLRKTEAGDGKGYCSVEPTTNSTTNSTATTGSTSTNSTTPGSAAETAAGGWYKLTVPLSAFDCGGGGLSLADVDQFDFQNEAIRNAVVCIGDVTIVR